MRGGDEELRELERVVREGGGPQERLRLATELERRGRRDDAVSALLPAIGDAEVRRALGRAPAWSEVQGPGRSSFADVRALRVRPRIRWTRGGIEGGERVSFAYDFFLASVLGVVIRPVVGPVVVLDADTGATRWGLGYWKPVVSPFPAIAGEHALIPDASNVERVDLWTASRPPRIPIPGDWRWGPSDGFVVARREGLLEGHEIDRGRVWSVPLPPQLAGEATSPLLCAAGGLAIPWARPGRERPQPIVALDRTSGAVRWTDFGLMPLVDTGSVVVPTDGAFELRRHDGTVVFRREGPEVPVALVPEGVIAQNKDWVAYLYPRDGRGAVFLREGGQVLNAARGVVYRAAGHAIVAVDLTTGDTLWNMPISDGVLRAAPLPGRLVVIDGSGRVVCLEEGP